MAFVRISRRNSVGQAVEPVYLTDMAFIDDVQRPAAPFNASFTDIQATGNAMFNHAAPARPTVSMRATLTGATLQEARAKLRSLMAVVSFTEPMALEFEDDGGLYYMVVPNGARQVQENIDSVMVQLAFSSLYPWLLGESNARLVSGTGTSALQFPGGYPMPLGMSSSVKTDANGEWGFSWTRREWNVGKYYENKTRKFKVSGFSASSSYQVVLNPESMQIRFGGYYVSPSVDSVWPETDRSGSITISNVLGGSDFYMSATERWL